MVDVFWSGRSITAARRSTMRQKSEWIVIFMTLAAVR